MNFKIPRGEQGIEGKIGLQGPTEPKGEKGDIGPQGIKGEKGDQGPATIQIGNVETIEPNEEAEVVNSGTPIDVVLDFKLPRGEQGETGPRGLPGEIGRTEHIAIDETETIEPGEPAEVMDTFENWVHHLAFFIPKGEKGDKGDNGERGPQGPCRSTWNRIYIFLWNAIFNDRNTNNFTTSNRYSDSFTRKGSSVIY